MSGPNNVLTFLLTIIQAKTSTGYSQVICKVCLNTFSKYVFTYKGTRCREEKRL